MSEHLQRLILVDGSSYLYRAFHAMPNLTAPDGRPTGAIFGVLNMLQSLLRGEKHSHIAMIFDAKGKTFRHDLYPEYKANRPPMPDDMRQQVATLHQLIRDLGIPLLAIEGVEADDVIGTLALRGAAEGYRVLISTGDKDMAQLVNDSVELVNTMSHERLDHNAVKEKFGVSPEQIIDYLALMGDKSDNVPGVPKVGPKTAVKWLDLYRNLDGVIEHAGDIKGKVGESLRDSLQQLELARDLVTIRCNVELDIEVNQLVCSEADRPALLEHYRQLGFRRFQEDLEKGEASNSETNSINSSEPTKEPRSSRQPFETIMDDNHFQEWLTLLDQEEIFAFDTETTSLNYLQAEIVGLCFATLDGRSAYLPLAHDYLGAPEQLDRESVLKRLQPILANPERHLVGQNLKYDKHILANYGLDITCQIEDTMLQSYSLNSTAVRHNMDALAHHYLGETTIKYEDVAGKGAKQISFSQVEIEQASEYAAEDAAITLQLYRHLQSRLNSEPALQDLYRVLELPVMQVLTTMERTGVLIDCEMLQQQSRELEISILDLEKQAHTEAGGPFNLGSPKQLQEILFQTMELPVVRKTPKGQPSTAEDVLQELAEDYALPRLILEYRSLSKLKSTYTEKLPQMINPGTGRLHTSYHQAVAATGRLSSSDPNLQNIPVRTPEGRRIRQAFIAPEGKVILAADYSQIELRIMAHLSADPGLLSAFSKGEDIHQATAAEVMGIPAAEVTREQRRSAKAINFGLIYGMSAFGLAKQLGIARPQAQEYIDLYFKRYPGVLDYMDRTKEQAREKGYVETLFGRRLYLPDIKASNAQRRQYAERTAINAPMQGSAADIIKRAMLSVDQWLAESQVDAKMIMQVHDELVFEVGAGNLDRVQEEVTRLMEKAVTLDVPLLVESASGTNWDQAH